MTNFPLTTPTLTALIVALQATHQKADRAAQEILKRVLGWQKMLAQLDRDDWTWLDGLLDKHLTTLLPEAQALQGLSYYLANGQFATVFALVQGLIRPEIANKRRELEKLAEARAHQTVVESEKISAAFAQIPIFDNTLKAIAQNAKTASENDSKIEEVLDDLTASKDSGAAVLEELNALLANAKEQISEAIADAKSSSEAASNNAATTIARFASDVEDEKLAAVEAKDAAVESRSNAEEADAAIQKMLTELVSESDAAQQQIKISNEALDQKAIELKEATTQLKKARADLNRQGLADAFAKHATKLTRSRRWVDTGFYCILVAGAIYIGICAWLAKDPTWVHWLQKLSPLSIVVWIGWTLASRSNVLSRLIEDYEFKAATALAFQGYRSEMDSQPELLSKLLDKAIGNFGANPTRLMPQAKSHHAHPIEAAIEKGAAYAKDTLDSAKSSLRG